jgi:hypothetical protein
MRSNEPGTPVLALAGKGLDFAFRQGLLDSSAFPLAACEAVDCAL